MNKVTKHIIKQVLYLFKYTNKLEGYFIKQGSNKKPNVLFKN